MPIAITTEHRELEDAVRAFAVRSGIRQLARAALEQPEFDPRPTVKQLAETGWLGLHLSSASGGSDFGWPEIAVVLEELGSALVPGAAATNIVAAALLDEFGVTPQSKDWAQLLVRGQRIAAIAFGPGIHRAPDATICGAAAAVLGAQCADTMLVRVGPDIAVLDVPAHGVSIEDGIALDPSLGIARVMFKNVPVADGLTLTGAATRGVTILRTAFSIESAGGARACARMALEYARVREQFDRPIGSFQAVKHHLANMAIREEQAVAAAWGCARAAAEPDQADAYACAASAVTVSAYRANAQMAIQILGGIGYTWEHDAHLYLRRAVSLSVVADDLGSSPVELFDFVRRRGRLRYSLELPPEAEVFREQAREFVARYRATHPDRQAALLRESGYLVPHWPKPYGRAAGATEKLVLAEELAVIDPPTLGIAGWVLRTLLQVGSPEQVERWIGPGLVQELTWCQLFSEPDAGSDAAAVRTRGIRVDGGWLVTGQKVWSSEAHLCNRGLMIVRTDPSVSKHRGITAMVVDLKSDGVDIRPLRDMTGAAKFNEIFFNKVFVPEEDVVGAVGEGWQVARATFNNERLAIGGGNEGDVMSAYELVDLDHDDTSCSRADIGALIAEEHAMRLMNIRAAVRAVANLPTSSEGVMTKLLSAEHAQRVSEMAMCLVGVSAVVGGAERISERYLFARCLTIAGGTSEIIRNLIAERILGLPREQAH